MREKKEIERMRGRERETERERGGERKGRENEGEREGVIYYSVPPSIFISLLFPSLLSLAREAPAMEQVG